MLVLYTQDKLHRMTWYTGRCEIATMGLLYMLTLWSNVCIIWALDPMVVLVTNATLMSSHYRTNIISSVGHPRLDSVMLLVLCAVTYNM